MSLSIAPGVSNTVISALSTTVAPSGVFDSGIIPLPSNVNGLSIVVAGDNNTSFSIYSGTDGLRIGFIGTYSFLATNGYQKIDIPAIGQYVRMTATGSTGGSLTVFTVTGRIGSQNMPFVDMTDNLTNQQGLITRAVISDPNSNRVSNVNNNSLGIIDYDAIKMYGDRRQQTFNPVLVMSSKVPNNTDSIYSASTIQTFWTSSKRVTVSVGGFYTHFSRRFGYISPGSACIIRFAFRLMSATDGTVRIGLTDNEVGPYFGLTGSPTIGALIGYNYGGSVRRSSTSILVTNGCTTSGNLTLTWFTSTITVAVTAGDSVGTVATKIAAGFNGQGLWNAVTFGATVFIRSVLTYTDTSVYTLGVASTGVAGTVTIDLTSSVATNTEIGQTSWLDKADGSGQLPALAWNQPQIFEMFVTNDRMIWSIANPNTGLMVPVYVVQNSNPMIGSTAICPSIRALPGSTLSADFEHSDISVFESTTNYFPRNGSKSFQLGIGLSFSPSVNILTGFRNPLTRNNNVSLKNRVNLNLLTVSNNCNSDVTLGFYQGYTGNDNIPFSNDSTLGAMLMTTGVVSTSVTPGTALFQSIIRANSSVTLNMNNYYIDDLNTYYLGLTVPSTATFTSFNGTITWTELE